MFGSSVQINRKFILEHLSQEDIFHKYLGIFPILKKQYRNPLRTDNNPTCSFYYNPQGILKFRDHNTRDNFDCFNIVQILYRNQFDTARSSFQQALEIIAADFGLTTKTAIHIETRPLPEEQLLKVKKKTSIQIATIQWTKKHINYWSQFGITQETLDYFRVYPISHAWVDGGLIYSYQSNDLGFAYDFGNGDFKLYFPNRKSYRFIQNIGSILQGYAQLPSDDFVLVITKSYKDVISMRQFGIYAVAPVSESVLLTDKQFEDLSNRFFHIFSLMDRDRAGFRAAINLKNTYNIEPIMFGTPLFRKLNEPKDFTDNVKEYGNEHMINLIQETKKKLQI